MLIGKAIEALNGFYNPKMLMQQPEYTTNPDTAPEAEFSSNEGRKSEGGGVSAARTGQTVPLFSAMQRADFALGLCQAGRLAYKRKGMLLSGCRYVPISYVLGPSTSFSSAL